MPAPRKYPDELRQRATRMAVDARRDRRRTGYRDVLNLPHGFHPVGIGPVSYAYFGSLLGGADCRASPITGKGKVIDLGLGRATTPSDCRWASGNRCSSAAGDR